MRYLLMLVVICTTLMSCHFSENLYINEDGSGRMEFNFDGGEIMEMAGDELAKEGDEAIDSTFTFKSILEEEADSIAKMSPMEQASLKQLENFSIRMKMIPAEKEMILNMFTEFKSVSELQDMFAAMQDMQRLSNSGGNQGNPLAMLETGETTDVSYTYDGVVFKRTVKLLDSVMHRQALDSLGDMANMFAGSTYKLNYHFPRPIKSVSNESALFSADKKSVTLEYGFMEYLENPESLNLDIVLEDQ